MRPTGAIVTVLASLVAAGCGSSPPSRFYTLTSVAPAARSASLEPRTVSPGTASALLVLGRLTLPSVLDRPEIVTRLSATRIDYSDVRRWAAPLDQMARQVLSDDLASRTGRPATMTDGTPLVLALEISQFDADPSGQVTLDTRWAVTAAARDTPTMPAEHADLQVLPGPGDSADVAATMSRALAMLADRIVARLPPGPR
jgi:uncharacterized protein